MAATPARSNTVVIVEHQPVLRAGLGRLIDNAPEFRWTHGFAGMDEALPFVEADTPDLLLTGLGLPGTPSVEGIRRLKRTCPELVVLVLSVHDDDERIFDAVLAGARGNVLKAASPLALLASLRLVAAGGAPMSPVVARQVLERWRDVAVPRLDPAELSALETLAQGHLFESAASELGLSVGEIGRRMNRVYDRLHARTVPTTRRNFLAACRYKMIQTS